MRNDKHRDDLMSIRFAIHQLENIPNQNTWVAKSGFLPTDSIERENIINTVVRGFDEMKQYLQTQNLG